MRLPASRRNRPPFAVLGVGVSGLALVAGALTLLPSGTSAASTAAGQQAAALAASSQSAPATSLPGGFTPAEFKNPARQFKPAIRWWWQGPLNDTEAIREVHSIADAGFGEVEIAFSSGAWATDEQRTILGKVLDEADRLGIKVSMTMGAAWPVQTPSTGEGSGYASQELQYGRVSVAAGQKFSGALPEPIDAAKQTQPRKLVAVTAARVTDSGPAVTTPGQPPAKSTVLDPASLTDLTARVTDGKITWQAPGSGDWVLFAFWSRENQGHNTNPFDADAARKATQDLDDIQIGKDNAPKLKKTGADLFEDSLELHGTSIFWTPKMEQEFKDRRGYSMAKFLPLMFVQGMSDFPVPPKEPNADFDLPDGQGVKFRNDYYTTLTDLYVDDHLTVFQDWAKKYGMQYKAQAAYLQDLEPIRSFRELVKSGARAETESLNAGENLPVSPEDPAWRNSLDFQRTIASGVHQAGGTELSTELGAIFKPAYSMNLNDYRDLMNKEWAAGVSQPFIHGFAFQTANAAWPGTARFGENVTDSWNDKTFPQWSSWPALNDYFARGTRVLNTGTAKTDVAVYSDAFLSPRGNQTPFDSQRLEESGYSVEYLDPQGLAKDAAPKNGELFAKSSGYRAIVVDQRAISQDAAAALLKAAKAGVRVVFVGDLPSTDSTNSNGASGDKTVKQDVAAALKQPSATRVVGQADVADALQRLRLSPRVASDGTQILSQWREVTGGAYVYLYNPSDSPVSVSPSFAVDGVPSELNLWDGTVSPVAQYSTTKGRTVVPMTLGAHETKVIAVNKDARPAVHVSGSVTPRDGELITSDGKIIFRAAEAGEHTFKLSNGRNRTVTAQVYTGDDKPLPNVPSARPSLIDPWSSWQLKVQTATPSGGENVSVSGALGDSQFQQLRLKDWRDIPQLTGESGVGTYTANTTLSPDWRSRASDGMWLDIGRVDGTADISVNGKAVGTQINSDRRWDITDYLHAGSNTVEIKVRTTLRNAVTTYNKKSVAKQSYGLRGPITLQPYESITVYDPQRS
ncbi:glycosyl hydrolase [Streptomyces sp. NPDC004096]